MCNGMVVSRLARQSGLKSGKFGNKRICDVSRQVEGGKG